MREGVDLELPNIKLYLDDLDDLVAFLDQHCEKVEIHMLGGRADSADDLRDATPHELGFVTIEGTSPNIRVELHHHGARIVSYDPAPGVRVIAEDAGRLLAQRKRSNLERQFWLWLPGPSLVLLFLGLYWLRPWLFIIAAVLVAFLASTVVGIYTGRIAPLASPSAATIVPTRRGEATRIGIDRRITLVLAIIGLVTAAALTYWQITAGR